MRRSLALVLVPALFLPLLAWAQGDGQEELEREVQQLSQGESAAAPSAEQLKTLAGSIVDQMVTVRALGKVHPVAMEVATREQIVKYVDSRIGEEMKPAELAGQEAALKRLGVVPSAQLGAQLARGAAGRVRLAGIVVARKERTSAKGNRFAFVQMSDLSGLYEVVLFSETLSAARGVLDSGQPLFISADARLENEDTIRLTAQSVQLLDEAAAASSAGLKIFVESPGALAPLKQVLGREGRLGDAGRKGGRLRLVLPADRREVEIALPGLYEIGAQLRSAVKAIPGVADLHDF